MSEKRRSEASNLEDRFEQAMYDVYYDAKKECNYNATYFLQMLGQYGGLGTARRLLTSTKITYGFTTLWECGRLDLSVEAKVLRPEFAPLFAQEERDIARDRLAEYGYQPKND